MGRREARRICGAGNGSAVLMKRHDGDHDPEHPVVLDDGSECLGCRIRGGFVPALGRSVTATRTPSKKLRPMKGSSWEKGIAGETRPGGGFMPYLNPKTFSEIGVKEAGERRTEHTRIRESQLHNPNHFGPT